MSGKKKLTVVFPNILGGVSSFNANLVNSKCELRKEFEIHVILLQDSEDKRPHYSGELGANQITIFKYSSLENQYYVCKRLYKILSKTNGMVICDHFLVLNTISCFRYQQTIFHLLHDFYYVQQNFDYPKSVDFALAHSSFFIDCILAWNTKDYLKRARYIPYGVTIPEVMQKSQSDVLNVVFLGRLTAMKGVTMLKSIEDELRRMDVKVNWTIIGKGELKKELVEDWKENSNVRFIEPEQIEELYGELMRQDVFVFPTLFEGTPVSIFEALANGVVPIVNDLPGGIRDHVNSEIGFRVENEAEQFALILKNLNLDRRLLAQLQKNSFEYAQKNLNIDHNMSSYFELFSRQSKSKNNSKQFDSPRFNRLDRRFIPNIFVKIIRLIV